MISFSWKLIKVWRFNLHLDPSFLAIYNVPGNYWYIKYSVRQFSNVSLSERWTLTKQGHLATKDACLNLSERTG